MPRVLLLNTENFPCPGSHFLHTKKFLSFFTSHNYQLEVIESDIALRDVRLSSKDIIYFSDHGVSGKEVTNSQIEELARVKSSKAFPIFWHWHNHASLLDSIFVDRWLLTGEYLRSKYPGSSHEAGQSISLLRRNYLPLRFAAAVKPESVGTHPRFHKWDASFVGHRYQTYLNTRLFFSKWNVAIHYTPPFISEQRRLEYFLGSRVVLGWHSTANRFNGVVVERVFEGMALGALVVTDNPFAIEATDGNVLFVDDFAAVSEVIHRSIVDDDFYRRVTTNSLSWARSHGTYDSVVRDFLKKMNELSL